MSYHVLVYGDSGSGKSTFLSSLRKPLLVLMWDPIGKETPYLNLGKVELDDVGTQRVYSRKTEGKLLAQVEHFHDADPHRGDDDDMKAYARYLARMARFDAEREESTWGAVICDSVTFMSLAARKYQQYILNPTSKDPRQWHGGATDALEEQLMLRFGAMRCDVGVACHIDDKSVDLNGAVIRVPNAPGRLSRNLPAAFSEVYHAMRTRDDKTKKVNYSLQTQADDEWVASTQITGLPPVVEPSFKVIKSYMPSN